MGLSEFVNVPGGGRLNAADVQRTSALTCDWCNDEPGDGDSWRAVDLVVRRATPSGFAQGSKTTYYFCSDECQAARIQVASPPA